LIASGACQRGGWACPGSVAGECVELRNPIKRGWSDSSSAPNRARRLSPVNNVRGNYKWLYAVISMLRPRLPQAAELLEAAAEDTLAHIGGDRG
jgi:uncharacterized protein (DUF3084 family)